jgi:hypothetical protein
MPWYSIAGDVVGFLAFCLLGSLRVAAARKIEAGSCFLRSVCSVQLRLLHTRAGAERALRCLLGSASAASHAGARCRSWSLRRTCRRRRVASLSGSRAPRREQEGDGAAGSPPRYHRPRPRRAVAGATPAALDGRGDAGEALVAAGVQVAVSPPLWTVAA